MPDLTPIIATAGWPTLWASTVVAFVTLIMRGDLVSRKVHEAVERQRDLAWASVEKQRESSDRLNLEVARLTADFAKSMKITDHSGTGT